ncbi:preprotein translocase subunit SecA [uncultured Traorella sp.]|uniref:preprotein translocase subunit SecA n=1 Tax=uncultured Traorella sp. TaxID=1929048 RepID=UPI0025F1C4C3|nr:preprotein translocase subunit SecA [uncultured Traorella sp.]
MGFLTNIFNEEKRIMKQYEKKANEVVAYESTMAALSDDELKAKTNEFKERLKNGETKDDILPEAFATIREAAKRVLGEFPFYVQILGALILNGGDIAEMKTGEGKTLTSIMCVYLNALEGKGVHVITVNDYLAGRDAAWMGQIYEFLGMTVGVNKRELNIYQKQDVYKCDITYTTNAELGFDYLRDNMVTRPQDRVMRGLHFAIIDEVDSILIDEARTPLIISGGKKQTADYYRQADIFAKSLSPEDYVIDVQSKAINLTDSGVDRAEKMFKINNLYDLQHVQLVHHISQALKANYIMTKDVEYVVSDGEIVIVDQFTGRIMKGRAFSDGLHQALEAKEGCKIREETATLATITYQNFFRLYEKLAGMTGTAKTEEEEFLDTYNMRVLVVPTNRPVQRIDYPDVVYRTPKLKFDALMAEAKQLHEKGQPVLIGTISVEVSERLSEMFTKEGIKHQVLNAKNHAREAEIIKHAGEKGAVTIATNMAGRGTDIKINDEVRALGGLAVLGSERHESRRIDNQLRGRSGRQGDPGFSRFYVSLKDELMVRFGSERLEGLFEKMGDTQIESSMVTKAISSAQKRVEGQNYDIRKSLLEYDDVLRQQREVMYEQRDYVLNNDDVHSVVYEMFTRVFNQVVANNSDPKSSKVNGEQLLAGLKVLGCPEDMVTLEEIDGKDLKSVVDLCLERDWKFYNDKIEDVKENYLPFEKTIVLKNMDRNWIDHIDTMDKLRSGIYLRSYAQDRPLQAYVEEGYAMFEEMMENIAREVVFFANRMKIEVRYREYKK